MARVQSSSPGPDDEHGQPTSPRAPNKREKRRHMLAERLMDMTASFSDNRDAHFRAQITAVQHDLSFILKVDPYSNRPLDDFGAETTEVVQHITGGAQSVIPSPQADFSAQVGRFHSAFVDEVNDALEERDVDLSILHAKYESTLSEVDRLHSYRSQLAVEEHKALKNTLRERLIQQLNQKRTKLLREKEQLDIADSNALLLHPNQFTTANPASPGGPPNPRKTRHTRHRAGETEEMADSRRKRKAATMEEDNGSPAPTGRIAAVDAGFSSPFRDAKAKTVYTQYEAPVYSIERLFTEKELSLSRNIAEHATLNFFKKPRVPRDSDADPANSMANGNGLQQNGDPSALDDPVPSTDPNAMDTEDAAPNANASLLAPDMARTSSYHTTRNSARTALDSYDAQTERLLRMPVQGPVFLAASFTAAINKPNAVAPPPPALTPEDVANDLGIMTKEVDPGNSIIDKILMNATTPLRTREFKYPDGKNGDAAIAQDSDLRGGGLGSALPAHLDALGGVPMSAQSSMAGYSDGGGSAVPGLTGRGMRRGFLGTVTEYTPEKFVNRN